ncbi:hypothetical protein ABDK56_12655 [Sphingomonas sp. ASV193]|uniref:hypothetical protein n=1 Tax=Sphingomonas sp. ASV193 TaxID=3144405 RepID=UPI0032E88001
MPPPILFDPVQRPLRQARAAAIGDSFLVDHALADARQRLAAIDRPKEALLVLRGDRPDPPAPAPASLDAIVIAGALETVEELPALMTALRHALRPDRPLLGSLIGGDSFPTLRRALVEADRAMGRAAAPRAHPRIDAPSLAALLQHAGFAMPVVEVERTTLAYRSLGRLVADLRAAGLTNQLAARPRGWPGRGWPQVLDAAFAAGRDRIEEPVEWLHFLAWSPPR